MRSLGVVMTMLALSACDLAPDFELPSISTPAAFKEDTVAELPSVEAPTEGKWKRSDANARIEEFAWWRMFDDSGLDALEERAMKDNPTLEAALARVQRARAVADNRESDLYPQIGASIGPERSQSSPAAQERNLPTGSAPNVKPQTLYTARGTITYELDLFGRNRGLMKAADEDANVEANNYRAARLALQAELAQTYFRVAALRAEDGLLKQTVISHDASLMLVQKKHAVGEVDTLVLSSAEAELARVQGDAAIVAQSLAVAEHALAVLVGVPPSELRVETRALNTAPPSVPAGLPSRLLERRPDVQAAISGIAAANERIGIARTGYFPDISLSAAGGFVAGDLDGIFEWSNRAWSIGALLTQPIFEGGRIAAAKAQASADYAAATANYKAAVLQSFREVEDNLSGLRNVGEQAKAAQVGLLASRKAFDVASDRFKVGYSSRLEYLDAERSKLAAERAAIQVMGARYITTVQLVKALGGSWEAPPAPEVITPSLEEATPGPRV